MCKIICKHNEKIARGWKVVCVNGDNLYSFTTQDPVKVGKVKKTLLLNPISKKINPRFNYEYCGHTSIFTNIEHAKALVEMIKQMSNEPLAIIDITISGDLLLTSFSATYEVLWDTRCIAGTNIDTIHSIEKIPVS